MVGKSKIEWCDSVWNPVTGCGDEIISPGCQNCYARRMAHRLAGRYGYPKDNPFRVTLHPERLDQPIRWKKPQRIFVCSMGDLFHPDVPDEFISEVGKVIYETMGKHTYFILTKRPQNMLLYQKRNPVKWWPFEKSYVAVTVCNQKEADEKIPLLLQIPATVRWVSLEPMLGGIDLKKYLLSAKYKGQEERWTYPKRIDWVVLGGESGPGARPMHPEWVRSVRDQCVSARVPFFFKQWGEWGQTKLDCVGIKHANREGKPILSFVLNDPHKELKTIEDFCGCGIYMERIGKKSAGRLLDGREWDELPKQ